MLCMTLGMQVFYSVLVHSKSTAQAPLPERDWVVWYQHFFTEN